MKSLLSKKAALDTVGDTEMNKSDSRPGESSQSISEDRQDTYINNTNSKAGCDKSYGRRINNILQSLGEGNPA